MDSQSALPVLEADDDDIQRIFDEGPSTAEEYLLWVRLQAEDIGEVVRADVDTSAFEKNQSLNYAPLSRPRAKCDADYLPAPSFMNRVLAEFADLRQYLCEMGAHGVGSKASNQRVAVPAMKDEEGWHQFCFGLSVPLADGTESVTSDNADNADSDSNDNDDDDGKIGDDSDNESAEDGNHVESGNPETDAVITKKYFSRACAPKASILLQFDQVLTRRLVGYHVNWIQTSPLSRARAVWMYALLARLDKPIPADLSAVLRELYLRLCELRAEAVQHLQSAADPEHASTNLACVNVMLVIVGRYFEQEELDDRLDFEEDENTDQFVL